ncbi:hypothetical protein NKR23_g3809 [Pleurostoma richardsiae]|uniref:Uncharacterized protein n=1 Tax=Pleurostoma richardsiae TaxID=41990 RepID=A0AA38RY63_9PEZI|nr:hypothetical protein NKR23_g3809 [Pleurostoma richardsiae]
MIGRISVSFRRGLTLTIPRSGNKLLFLASPPCGRKYVYGAMFILSALPFVSAPFPSRETAEYYKRKNDWNVRLSGGHLTRTQTGFLGAALRVMVGLGVLFSATRQGALLGNGAVVSLGTVLAYRDGRPMVPQLTMLAMVAWCLGT